MDFISKENAEYLIKCVKENKNIIVTGEVGIGKTTLLNAIINCQENVTLMLYEKTENEIVINDDDLNRTIIRCKKDSMDMFDILKIAVCDQDSRLVLGEIASSNDVLGMIYSLNMGSSVLGTGWCDGNWRECFIKSFDGKMKKYVEESLEKIKFIQVSISMIEGKRTVSKIEEV